MAKVSLIIPVYNAAAHIGACLESVLAQTLDDLEVILVDDHGSDDSIAIARQLVADYSGTKQFRFTATKTNTGPGAARNLGIQDASGEYVAFLDSDDLLAPDFCQRLYEAASRAQADMAFGAISFDYPDGSSSVRFNPPVQDGPFEGKAKRAYLRRFKSYFTTYLYSRNMLRECGICFPDTHSAEDSCFLSCSLLSARRIAGDDHAIYHYTIHPASTSQRRDQARWKNRLASFRALVAFARSRGLYKPYGGTIRLLVLKKGWLMAFRDYLSNNLRK